MSDELRAAAARVRRARADSDDHDGGYPATEEGRLQSLFDHAALAEAWLTEHPADDGGELCPTCGHRTMKRVGQEVVLQSDSDQEALYLRKEHRG